MFNGIHPSLLKYIAGNGCFSCRCWFYYTKNPAFFQANSKHSVTGKERWFDTVGILIPLLFYRKYSFHFISANLSFMASLFHCSRFHHHFFHPLLFNKSCPCLTKVQALPVRCFLGLFHKPIPAFTENFCTLPFVLPAKSPPQAVFSKCGLQTEPFEYGSFENIQNYNSLALFMALGNYTIRLR